MHEVGVMQSALEIALEQAGRQGAGRIDCIALRVGMLSGVVPEALEFAFDVVARGTIAEGGRLVVERVPIRCVCAGCGAEFPADDLIFDCPHCRRPGARVRHGRELELAYLEVS
jgi:hydrogenase nickel incorporation protein HypA/HybF